MMTARRAFVYNDYLSTLGGGERSSFAYALALCRLGYETEVLTTLQAPEKDVIARVFGSEFSGLKIRQIKPDQLVPFLESNRSDVFVNHTFMSFLQNYGKIGLYSQMFPAQPVDFKTSPLSAAALQTYHRLLCNSSFTQIYTRALWQYPPERVEVLIPPISEDHCLEAQRGSHAEKSKIFLNVGRFNPGMHSKNQKILIEAFLRARRQCPALESWQLVLVGNVNSDADSQAYFSACSALADAPGSGVQIKAGLPVEELVALYRQASFYVHATGAFLPPGTEPEKCEHLGLSVMESMAYGCVPIVYGRGGIFDVLQAGVGGVPYLTPAGLTQSFIWAALGSTPEQLMAMRGVNRRAIQELGQHGFTDRLSRVLDALQGEA